MCRRFYGLVSPLKIHMVNSNIGSAMTPSMRYNYSSSSDLLIQATSTASLLSLPLSICCLAFVWPPLPYKQHHKRSCRRSCQLSFTFGVSLNTSAAIDLHVNTSDELAVVTR